MTVSFDAHAHAPANTRVANTRVANTGAAADTEVASKGTASTKVHGPTISVDVVGGPALEDDDAHQTMATGPAGHQLNAHDLELALSLCFGTTFNIDQPDLTANSIGKRLNQVIAVLDSLIADQTQSILHHPQLQRLEAAWRGVELLTRQSTAGDGVKIKLLDVSWKEIGRDVNRAADFDQSQLFKKIYSDEFGMPGGEPIGLLVGDYDIRHRPTSRAQTDDLSVLEGVGHAVAAAFVPTIMAASPELFGVEHMAELEQPIDFNAIFAQPEYDRWRRFQQREDARFIALAMPRVLMRTHHGHNGVGTGNFCFREELDAHDASNYLWGNAAFAFACVAIRAFAESGWLANVCGVDPDQLNGGIVSGLPQADISTDAPGLIPKPVTEVQISDVADKTLTDLGFLTLSFCKTTGHAIFYGSSTVQTANNYDRAIATVNSRLSTRLQYILCASRFAHYVKVIARDKIGSFVTADQISSLLNNWLLEYCNNSEHAGAELKARYPLKNAKVEVKEQAGRPGKFWCTIHLQPHFQFDQVISSIKLVTQLTQATSH